VPHIDGQGLNLFGTGKMKSKHFSNVLTLSSELVSKKSIAHGRLSVDALRPLAI